MPDALQRGRVVARAGLFGVVWTAAQRYLIVVPIDRFDNMRRGDLVLDLAQSVACGVLIADATISPAQTTRWPRDGITEYGTVPPKLMCQIVVGIVRALSAEKDRAKWQAARQQRDHADDRCVNLND